MNYLKTIWDNIEELLGGDAYETIQVTPMTPTQPTPSISPFPKNIITWANVIQVREGGQPNDPNMLNNNPGDIKATKYGMSLGKTTGTRNGFCVYETYQIGFNALCQLLSDALNGELIGLKPTMSILQFTAVYAEPPTDDYAKAVATAFDLSIMAPVKDILDAGDSAVVS